MTIAEQLHNSATHRKPTDPACPICNPLLTKLAGMCKDLERCAKQNEEDDKYCWSGQARAVAAEQRRMLRILRTALAEITRGAQ